MRHVKRKTPVPKQPAATSSSNGNGIVDESVTESTAAPQPGPSQPEDTRAKRPKATENASPSPRVTRSGRGPQKAVARVKSLAAKKVKAKAPEPLTFRDLADKLDPNPQAPTQWRKFIDRDDKMIMFYNLDLKAPIPKISKSVQVRCISVKEEKTNTEKQKLVPTVCSNGRKLSPAKVSAVLNSDYVETIEDLTKLVQGFDVLEDMEKRGGGQETQDSSKKPKKVRKRKLPENGTVAKNSESESLSKKRKPTNGIRKARKGVPTPEVAAGAETPTTANADESEPSVKKRKPANGPRKPRKTAPTLEVTAGAETQSTANDVEAQPASKKRKSATGIRKARKGTPTAEGAVGVEAQSTAKGANSESQPLIKKRKPATGIRKARKGIPTPEVAAGVEAQSTANGTNAESQPAAAKRKPASGIRKARKGVPTSGVAAEVEAQSSANESQPLIRKRKPATGKGAPTPEDTAGAETPSTGNGKRKRQKKIVVPPVASVTTAEPPPVVSNAVMHAEGQ